MARLSLYGNLRRLVSHWQVEIDGATVGDALRALAAANPPLRDAVFAANGALQPHVRVLLNGRDVELLQGLDSPLHDGDDVRVFPPIGGGTVRDWAQ